MRLTDDRAQDRYPETDPMPLIAAAFCRAAHRRALDVVAATDAVWLKRDAVAIPQRP